MKWNTSKFKKMNKIDQLSILGKFIYEITIYARGTYEVNSEKVTDPIKLRRLTEIIHRISSLHASISLSNDADIESFIDGTFGMLEQETEIMKIPIYSYF